TVVGTTSRDRDGSENLYLFDPDQKKPVWRRAVDKEVEKAPALEKGLYGTPTLPNGTRKELPQRDEKVWAPLSVAIHSEGKKKRIAVADYQGWQRWVRSSATMKDENQGLRFVPTKPTIKVYDEAGKVVTAFATREFNNLLWCDLKFSANGKELYAWPHHWKTRGIAGHAILLADERTSGLYQLDVAGGKVLAPSPGESAYDVAVDKGLGEGGAITSLLKPGLVRLFPNGNDLDQIVAYDSGVMWLTRNAEPIQINLNKAVPKPPKPHAANARARPIVKGVWQLPGGRVESDLGGQRVIEAPDGLILIEGHAGLSFEREWQSMEAVGLDPKKVKYV